MTKLLCPIKTCLQHDFGVPNTHQLHVEQHLLSAHNIRVTVANRTYWRKRQNSIWESRIEEAENTLDEAGSRHRKRMRDMMEAHLAPLETNAEERDAFEDAQDAYNSLQDVDSDSSDEEATARRQRRGLRTAREITREKRDEEWDTVVGGPKYSESLREHHLGRGKQKVDRALLKVNEQLAALVEEAEGDAKGAEAAGEAERNRMEDEDEDEDDEAEMEATALASMNRQRQGPRRGRHLMPNDAASRVGRMME